MSLDQATRSRIEQQVTGNRVVLYMKGTPQQPMCGFSAKTVAMVQELANDVVTFDVLADQDIREGIKVYGDWPTIPQLYVNSELVGGCDIITEMYNSGELHELLGVDKPDRTPPQVTITDKAAENIRAGMQGHDGLALHMSVDNEWRPSFTLQPPQPGAIVSSANGIELHFDLPSAQRAKGAMIDWIDAVDGSGLDVSLPAAPVPIKRMQPAELKAMLDAGTAPLIVDVRSPDDRQQLAPIPGAIGLDKDMLAELQNRPKDTAIVFVCNVGNSSMGAAEHFRKLGFSDVYNLEGGMQAWMQLG